MMAKKIVKKDRKKVFVTRMIPKNGITFLKKKGYEVVVYLSDKPIPRSELLKGVRWCDALLCLLTEKIDKEVIDTNPKLQVISQYAVGYDNIDVKYATRKGIPVTNTPGILSNAVAEHTMMLIAALTRRLVEADAFTRAGKYKTWKPMLFVGPELQGKTLGIIGTGRIGSDLAKIAQKGYSMRIIYTDMKRNRLLEKKYKAQYVKKEQLLKRADVISLHVPLLPSTKHLIGKRELSMMKKDSYLINTSRGPVIDEKALVKALKKKSIAGAALDVFEGEPKLAKGLNKLQNVILTPHIASATVESRANMADMAATNLITILEGKRPLHCVNPETLKGKKKKVIRAIGFDFDDTLIMSERDKADIVVEIFKNQFGVSRGVKTAYKSLLGKMNREQKLSRLAKKFLKRNPTRKELSDLNYAFSKGYEFKLASCPLVHCVGRLKEFRKKKVFMFLLSLENEKEVREVAAHCGVANYFDEILGGPKSKHENFMHIIKKHKVKPGDALYIGDSKGDVRKAKSLGIPVIAMQKSAAKQATLKKLGALGAVKDLCDARFDQLLKKIA